MDIEGKLKQNSVSTVLFSTLIHSTCFHSFAFYENIVSFKKSFPVCECTVYENSESIFFSGK